MPEERSQASGLARSALWVLAGMTFLVQVAWANLTGLGIGEYELTYDAVALPRLVVAAVGVSIVWLLISMRAARDGGGLAVDVTGGLLVALAGWAVVSAVASEQGPLVWLGQSERLEGVVAVALYAALFGAGLQLGHQPQARRVLSGALVAGAAALSVYGVMQAMGLDPTQYTIAQPAFDPRSAFASLDNPNFLGGHLVLALPVTVAMALTAGRRWTRLALWGAAILSAVAILATVSQGAWLALTLQAAVAVGIVSWQRRASRHAAGHNGASNGKRHPLPWVAPVAVLAAGVAAILVMSSLGLALGPTLETSGSARLLLVEVAVGAAAERPLVGYGPDAYLAAFRAHRPDLYVETFGVWSTNNNAHSWIVQYLATLGIPGALLLGAALVFGLSRGRPRGLPGSGADTVLSWGIWLGLLGYVVQSTFNVAVLASTVPFWILLGVACAARAKRVEVPRAAGVVLTAVTAVALAFVVVFSVRMVAADALYARSRLAYNGAIQGDSVALAERALELNPLSVKYARGAAQARAVVVFGALDDPWAAEDEIRQRYAEAERAYLRVLDECPSDYAALAWFAALQAATGDRLGDAALQSASVRTALEASALDRTAWQVRAIADGDRSQPAINSARSVSAVP